MILKIILKREFDRGGVVVHANLQGWFMARCKQYKNF